MPNCIHILKDAQPECGGICRIIANIARYASSSGYQNTILFLGDGPLVKAMSDEGVPAGVVPWTARSSDPAGAWQAWRWIEKQQADIAHVHHGGLIVRTVCRLAGVRRIAQHMHGRILEPSGASISDMNFRLVDAVIACSQAVADCLPKLHAEVIYSGVESRSSLPPTVPLEGKLKLGVLARLIPLKNIESVIVAAAQLAGKGIEVNVEIAGSGPSESFLRSLVFDLGLSDRVQFLGWRKDVEQLLESWDLLVIPSTEEGLPLSVLEAMAAARPVVATRVGGVSELVVDGVTGRIVPPADTEALVDCIAELAGDRAKLAHMGLEGWHRVQQFFSAEQMARQTIQLYDRLLDRPAHFSS